MLRKFAATTSTAALAIGMLAAGAGVAAAQDEAPSTGSMSSDSLGLDLEKTAADLELANQALNGPVDVTPTEDGAVVSFTNEGEESQNCVGMVFPYASIAGPDVDMDNLVGLLNTIEEGGAVSVLGVDEDGAPTATPLEGALLSALSSTPQAEVGAGDTIEWTADNENGPFAAGLVCDEINYGIDKQVVADQINGKIPGGSVAPVGPGSISGGSVALGANALGSLAGGDNEAEEPAEPAE